MLICVIGLHSRSDVCVLVLHLLFFFFSSRRRHTRYIGDWSSDVCSSDLLKRAVMENQADVGLAFDGDADRVFLVDEHAEGVSGSLVTALVARAILEKEPGATILHNLICSWVVPEVIKEAVGVPGRTRVGHAFMKQVMA